MSENTEKADEPRRNAAPRRAYIFETLSRLQKLAWKDLQARYGGKLAYQTLIEDVKHFRSMGYDYILEKEVSEGKDGIVILDASGRHDGTVEARTNARALEKSAIAQVAFGIIVGMPPKLKDAIRTRLEEISLLEEANFTDLSTEDQSMLISAAIKSDSAKMLSENQIFPSMLALKLLESDKRLGSFLSENNMSAPSTHEIETDMLAIAKRTILDKSAGDMDRFLQGRAAYKAMEVNAELKSFWKEMSRTVVLDAGTTANAIAHLLKNLPLPTPTTPLARLTVCTNSRGIFNTIGPASVLVKTIMIGGEQVARSEAVAGRMAEVFVMNCGILRFGLSIIGASGVCLPESGTAFAYSDTTEEATLKTLLFSRSNIKVLVIDHSKLRDKVPARMTYPFVNIQPEHVDLIITSRPLDPKRLSIKNEVTLEQNAKERAEFPSLVKRIFECGVPVLVAEEAMDGVARFRA